jgi:hypothetical protein
VNPVLFNKALSDGLRDITSQLTHAFADRLDEPRAANARTYATIQAALAYSNNRPLLRRMGTGNLFTASKVGDTTVLFVGGVWQVGDSAVLLDQFFPQETVTIDGLAPYQPTNTVAGFSVPVLEATLAVPLANAHSANALLKKVPVSGQQVSGLTLSPGVDTYFLPLDWISPQQDSFDLAVGAKATVRKTESYYDAVYGYSNAISSVGAGTGSDFLGGYLSGSDNPSLNAFPLPPGSGPIAPGASPGQTIYRFLQNDPPMLIMMPTPGQTQVLDFFYNGAHTINSIPASDFDAVLNYALYAACVSLATYYASLIDYTEEGVTEHPGQTSDKLMAIAKERMQAYENRIIFIPMAVTG